MIMSTTSSLTDTHICCCVPNFIGWFLPRDAMQARPMPSFGVCPSVCLSVRLSRSWILSKRLHNHVLEVFHRRVAKPFYFFRAKRYGNIPTGTPKWGVNRDSEPTSGFIACCDCCQRCSRLDINTVPPDRCKFWHLPLVVSGEVCWWWETTTKCLWQEASTLCQGQQNTT